MMQQNLLNFIVWTPAVFALILAILPNKICGQVFCQLFVALAAGLNLVFVFKIFSLFDPTFSGFQLNAFYQWIPSLGITYSLGIDGLSLWPVIFVSFLIFMLALNGGQVARPKLQGVSILVLLSAMLGTLLSLDLVVFYLFWELMLIPMFFLLGCFGGENKKATFTFVLYTLGASVFMLASIISLSLIAGSSSIIEIAKISYGSILTEILIFLGFALAFAVKIPIFPFHGWLPVVQKHASLLAGVIIAALLFQMGIYGFFRFGIYLFPQAMLLLSPYITFLGLIGVVYAALLAWQQKTIRGIAAYSIISHLGLCVIGFCAGLLGSIDAFRGTLLHSLNHGISVAIFFYLICKLEEKIAGEGHFDSLGGLVAQMPRLSFCLFIALLSLMALPLTNGFVGEFLLFSGSLSKFPLLTFLALLSTVVGVVYCLKLFQQALFGERPAGKENTKVSDLTLFECAWAAPFLALILFLGLCPGVLTEKSDSAIKNLYALIKERQKIVHQQEEIPKKQLSPRSL